jgi:hypothetical protein
MLADEEERRDAERTVDRRDRNSLRRQARLAPRHPHPRLPADFERLIRTAGFFMRWNF